MQDVIITALLAAVTAAAGLFLLLAKRGRGEMTGKQQRMMARIFLSALLLFVLQLLPAETFLQIGRASCRERV